VKYDKSDQIKENEMCHAIPWSRFLLEKLTALQVFKKFPPFYRTQKFIWIHHRTMSRSRWIQSTFSDPIYWRSIL